MKTTFDLPESLVHDVKKIARERGTTARAIVQQALTRVVEEAGVPRAFALEKASVPGWATATSAVRDVPLNELILQSYDGH